MRPLIVSHNLEGGAGSAAHLLHRGLREAGVDSHLLVQFDSRGWEATHPVPTGRMTWRLAFRRGPLDRVPVRLYPDRVRPHSLWPLWLPSRLVPQRVEELAPDVINLHWILDGLLSIEQVGRLNRPIVWTMHDMWPFTGGCAYSLGCERFEERCGSCPVLGSSSDRDLSRAVWLRKRQAWRHLDITAVAPSRWLAGEARRSSLFHDRRIEVIPSGIDTAVFKPMDTGAARVLLNLPQDRTLVMFGAHDHSPRKGMGFLVEALRRLSAKRIPRIAALVAGPRSLTASLDMGMAVRALGRLGDPYTMAAVYSAADVVVVPSVFENLPLVGLEAMACGTPVVAFNADTGIVDIVDHEENGYLAAARDPEDLGRGIEWVVADPERHARLSGAARAKAQREYTLAVSARRYADLFAEVLAPA